MLLMLIIIQIKINHICIIYILIADISPDLLSIYEITLYCKSIWIWVSCCLQTQMALADAQGCPALPLACFYFLLLSAPMLRLSLASCIDLMHCGSLAAS